MPNTPLTSARYPASSAAPNVNQDIQNLGLDLEDNLIAGPFASSAARDTAFSNWVALGNTMRDGLRCFALGDQIYLGGQWWQMTSGEQWGRTSANIAAATSSTGTVTFPRAFGATPTVMLTVESNTTGVDLMADITANSSTAFSWRVRERSATTGTYTATLHWRALPS